MPIVDYADIRTLPLPELSLRLLARLPREQINWNNTLRGFEQTGFGAAPPPDLRELSGKLADAWAWLQARALIGPSAQNPNSSTWERITATGQAVAKDPDALARVWADDRLAGILDPALTPARSNFAMGDYETASFAAMKAVEVQVRRAAELPDEVLGVALMRKAFSPQDGILRDPGADKGEQQATADLFAGAIGAYKNPASHRTVQFDDPMEAAEVIQLADLLLRIVKRAARRRATQPQ